MADPMPIIFIGHGNPMNALQRNAFTEGWAAVGARLPDRKPCWPSRRIGTCRKLPSPPCPAPRTIHDFGGFPRELYQVAYPAPSDPALASRMQVAGPTRGGTRSPVGPGSWHLGGALPCLPAGGYPGGATEHRRTATGSFHYAVGKQLAPLRDRCHCRQRQSGA